MLTKKAHIMIHAHRFVKHIQCIRREVLRFTAAISHKSYKDMVLHTTHAFDLAVMFTMFCVVGIK